MSLLRNSLALTLALLALVTGNAQTNPVKRISEYNQATTVGTNDDLILNQWQTTNYATTRVSFDKFARALGAATGVQASPDDNLDDSTALNLALTNGGLVVLSRPGVYQITNKLVIPSNTRFILHPGAIIRRMTNTLDAMVINKSDGSLGGYGAVSNIIIEGGTFDANSNNIIGQCTALAFSHGENITVRDTLIKNVATWHGLEFNSVKNGQAQNVTFLNTTNEALQIDYNDAANFPWFGPVDYTPCKNILIENCTFINGVDGIGSHSTRIGTTHRNVTIQNCTFTNLSGSAVKPLDYDALTVRGCWVENARNLISYGEATPANTNYGLQVIGNTVRNCTNGSAFHAIYIARGNKILIEGNTVTECSYNAICDGGNVTDLQIVGNDIRRAGFFTSLGSGISLSLGDKNGRVYNNKLAECYTAGILIGSGGPVTNCLIFGNVTTNTISLTAVGPGVAIQNNLATVPSNGQPAFVDGNAPAYGTPPQFDNGTNFWDSTILYLDFDGPTPFRDQVTGRNPTNLYLLNSTNAQRVSGADGTGARLWKGLIYAAAPAYTNKLSFSFWVKMNVTNNAAISTVASVVNQFSSGTSGSYFVGLYPSSTTLKLGLVTNGARGDITFTLPQSLTNDAWHHIGLTYQTNTGTMCYYDGEQYATNNGTIHSLALGTSYPLSVLCAAGAEQHLGGGSLDLLSVFSTVLTPGDMRRLYYSGNGDPRSMTSLTILSNSPNNMVYIGAPYTNASPAFSNTPATFYNDAYGKATFTGGAGLQFFAGNQATPGVTMTSNLVQMLNPVQVYTLGNQSGLGNVTTNQPGAGAGTTNFFSVTPNLAGDLDGQISVVTSGAPANGTNFLTYTFWQAMSNAPSVTLTPASSDATEVHQYIYVKTTTTNFSLFTRAGTALTAAKSNSWFYHIMR